MDGISLEAIVAVLIEQAGGLIEITRQDVEDTTFEGRGVAVSMNEEGNMYLYLEDMESYGNFEG